MVIEIWKVMMKVIGRFWKVDVDLESHPERESDESNVFVSAYGTVSLII